jgi:hypothetical protein
MVDMASQVVSNAIESSQTCQIRGEPTVVLQMFKTLASNHSSHSYFTKEEDHEPSHNGSWPSMYLWSQCLMCCGGDTHFHTSGMYVANLNLGLKYAHVIFLDLICSFPATHVSCKHASMITMEFMTPLSVTPLSALHLFH